VDLEVMEVGSGESTVVFVHGVLGSGRAFDRVADALDSVCRMRWYDRRGYASSTGRASSAGRADPVGVGQHVEDLVSVLDGRRAVLVGHSFGGVIALGAAARAPQLVGALVLYETSMAWAPGWDDEVMQEVLGSDDPEDAGLRLMFGARYDAMDADERARRRLDARAFIAEERSVRTGAAPYDVGDVRAPLVYGRSDPAVMPAVLEHLRREVDHVEAVTLPGAGHHAHRTAPGAFAGLVRRGLELART
jgi:pimeloyl-ACP methyl ester carboxylesterase